MCTPEAEYPAGQWEYMRFYEENFPAATAPMDANPANFARAIFRKGSPEGMGQPAGTAMVRKTGGWLGGVLEAPEVPRDDDVISESELGDGLPLTAASDGNACGGNCTEKLSQ